MKRTLVIVVDGIQANNYRRGAGGIFLPIYVSYDEYGH
jgi:hypothetical protein